MIEMAAQFPREKVYDVEDIFEIRGKDYPEKQLRENIMQSVKQSASPIIHRILVQLLSGVEPNEILQPFEREIEFE